MTRELKNKLMTRVVTAATLISCFSPLSMMTVGAQAITPADFSHLAQRADYVDGAFPQVPEEVLPAKDTDIIRAAATVSSKDLTQALAWANSQKGKALDIDGNGAECVDLTMYYSDFLFGVRTSGNGADYASRTYTGFTRLSKTETLPQAGDIAVWTVGYGHVGIVIASSGSSFTTLEQNVSGVRTVQQYSRTTGALGNLTFWGVQRPSLKANSPVPTITNGVYRLYNLSNGDHYYTTNRAEAESLRTSGLQYDGVFFYCASSGTQVYRAYNPNSGEHFYTTNSAEITNLVNAGWKNEGNAWKAPTSGNNVIRLYNPAANGKHLWTTSQAEITSLVNAGWRNEGTAFKG